MMKKLFAALLMIPAMTSASAQTEKTREFDNLYHFFENLEVFEQGQEEARAYYIPGHHVLPGYQVKPTRYERRLTIKPVSQK